MSYLAPRRLRLQRWARRAAPSLQIVLLVAFPIQQAVVHWGADRQDGFYNLLRALPVIVVCAVVIRRLLWAALAATPLRDRLRSESTSIDPVRAADPRRMVEQLQESAGTLALTFGILLVILLILAMTLFAFQRPKIGM
jgi:hypothetical protein